VTDTVEEKDAIPEETAVETPGPIFTRDIPGLAEYAKLFTTEGTEDTERQESLPRMDADERGPGKNDGARMVMNPILTRDLEPLGQSHAKMG
jgi:hypothetical protein